MSATGDRAADRTQGFTLIETLAALALTALVGALAFPSMDRALAAAGLAGAREIVKADLSLARAQAVRSGAPVAFSLQADGSGYAWTGAAPRRLPFAAQVRAAAAAPILFFADGSAAPGGLTVTVGRRRAGVAVTGAGDLMATALPAAAP
jgi:prepilin-type N-terminal cleavage/methylation domain-containing protein